MNRARVGSGGHGGKITESRILVGEDPIPARENRHGSVRGDHRVNTLQRDHDHVHIDGILEQDASFEQSGQRRPLDEGEHDRADVVQPPAVLQPPVGIGGEDEQIGVRPLVGGNFGARA